MDGAPGTSDSSLIERAKAIILSPKEEWPKIAAESQGQGEILRKYVLPLAAIGPVADFIGGQIFGKSLLFATVRPGFFGSLVSAIVTYIVAIVAVFVLAFIADFLAPKFSGKSNRLNAFKLVAYGATAAWAAQIFYLVPALSFFVILGLYSFYLFFTGTSPMMQVPENQRIAYTVVTFLCALVLNLVIGMIAGLIVGIVGLGGSVASLGGSSIDSDSDDVTISIPGVGSINTGKMEEAAERAKKIQSGELKAVPTETLKALLPDSIGSFQRTGLSTQAMGAAGAGVEGEYKSGDYQFDLRINDMLALSGLAGMGAAMGIERTEEDENGYERIGTVDGQWRTEKWDNRNNRGRFGIMIADRFQVEASGRVDDIAVLKNAVSAIDEGDLEDLAD